MVYFPPGVTQGADYYFKALHSSRLKHLQGFLSPPESVTPNIRAVASPRNC